MSDEHTHIWATEGCYCGAKQCVAEGYIGKDGKFIQASFFDMLLLNFSAPPRRCTNAAEHLGIRCGDHLFLPGSYVEA